jgi:DNA-binding GntR family transcriptional regulator
MSLSKKYSQNKSDAAQLAYDGIRWMLFHNEIVPGQKISYRELAEKLNLSLTPVIQALKRLEHQGLVHHKTNRGYFTAPMSIQEVEEIYELRELLEVSLLPAVLYNLNGASLKKLRSILIDDKSISQASYLNQKLLKDREFHLAIASLSGRKTQLQILEYLFDLLYLKYRGGLLFVASEKTVGSLHEDLLEALESRDLKLTRQEMKKHFRIIKKHALKALNSMMVEKQRFTM